MKVGIDTRLDDGNILLNKDESFIVLGSAGNKITEDLIPNTFAPVNFSGLDISTFDFFKLPRLSTSGIGFIDTTSLVGGEMVYDSTANVPKMYNGTMWKTIAFV